MKKFLLEYWFPIVSGIMIAAFAIAVADYYHYGVNVGDVWVYETSNPFSDLVRTNTVVDVRKGWVQYVSKHRKPSIMDGTNSEPIGMFKAGSTRILKGSAKTQSAEAN